MNEPLFRLGIIGAGAAARTLHMPGALASPRVALTALVDPVIGRAEALVREFGLSVKIAAEAKEVVAEVDGVLIATPNHTHRDITVACLNAGVPCLVEKPLATDVADAEEMCAAADCAGKVLAAGYTTRFRDEVILLHELLDQNYFGTINRFHYQEGTVGGWSPMSGYVAERNAVGGGVLTVVGAHFIDRMLYWFGYPDACNLVDDSKGGPEAHCVGTFGFSTWGARFEGTLLLSKTVALKPGLVIQAERGDVIFPMGRSQLYFRPRDNRNLVSALARSTPRLFARDKSDSQLEIENFVDACRGNAAPMVDGRQALLSVRLLEALYKTRTQLRERWAERRAGAVG